MLSTVSSTEIHHQENNKVIKELYNENSERGKAFFCLEEFKKASCRNFLQAEP